MRQNQMFAKYLTMTLVAVLLASSSLFSQKPGRRPSAPKNKNSEALIDAADKLLEERKWNEAIDVYQQAASVDPRNGDVYLGLGYAYVGVDKWTEALVAYKKAVELDPHNVDAQYALGDAYNTMRKHGDAIAPLLKATRLDPTFAEAHYGLGYAYLSEQQFAKSVSFLKSAIRLKPDYEDAHYGLAVAYLNLSNPKGLDDERKWLVGQTSALVKKLDSQIAKFNAAASEALASSGPAQSPADAPRAPAPTTQRTASPSAATPASESTKQRSQSPASSVQQTAASSSQDALSNRQLQPDASQAKLSGERRLALVIGNGAYGNAPPLKNPPNDARDMAARLKVFGFEVTTGINLNQREMKRLIRGFGSTLRAGGAGLFYYAGHGVQSKGHNYLIPIDADIQSEAEVEDFGVDVNLVLNFMDEAQNGLNIVILDACRDNPFGRSFRSASNGLAQVDAPTGTLIAYATAPGRVASDGSGQNGLYTSELLKQMSVAGLSATEMFMRVRAEVMKQTGNKQVPWEASSLVGVFYFAGPSTSAANPRPIGSPGNESKVDPAAFELSYWESIKNSTDAEELKSYLEKYPNGHFTVLANNRLRQLESSRNNTGTKDFGDVNAKRETSNSGGDIKVAGVKTFDVRNGVKATMGVLELSRAGLRYREVGGVHDFIIPCSALQVVTINTSWASTVFHKLHIKYSFNGVEKQVDLNGKNNKQMRDAILETCAIKGK
jgi:tetratricopeptide (TPR) repeat protein